MHYIIALHETDLTAGLIIKELRKTRFGFNKEYLDKNNFCDCSTYAYPNIRELRFLEIVIPEPAVASFESKLRQMSFYTFRTHEIFRRLFSWILKVITGRKHQEIQFMDKCVPMPNSRSIILFKKPDTEHLYTKHFVQCQKCKRSIPAEWL